MYYLRKLPYTKEYIDPVTKEKDYIEFTEDRALFKHNRFSRMYRKNYLCTESSLHLWKVKSLQNALQQRVRLFNYCNEWFDIYDTKTNTPIDVKLYNQYKPQKLDVARTTKTIYFNTHTGDVVTEKPSSLDDYKVYRKGTRLFVYNVIDYYQLWDTQDTLPEETSDIIVLVTKDKDQLLTFNTWEEYTLNGSPLIRTSWDDCRYVDLGENYHE